MINYGRAMKSLVVLLGLGAICRQAFASPWLEASDPFVRSDLTALSDSGAINSPTNHFPMLWSMLVVLFLSLIFALSPYALNLLISNTFIKLLSWSVEIASLK
ncbi:hypothetical protein [Vibrio aestuarianus]|uniref:hypothetical protein n=1 Tax=Vibrio aestuarianus TaxID=28171 RepID=UPI002468CB74|nr:hypothetical protein [Vibrio aestuarianus]MDH5882407.1 hypothetical protein [Vibrio aestuarianus]